MGMFNHVRCRYRLPDPEAQDFAFQTKSLPELLLDDYEITEDGRLLHRAYDTHCEESPQHRWASRSAARIAAGNPWTSPVRSRFTRVRRAGRADVGTRTSSNSTRAKSWVCNTVPGMVFPFLTARSPKQVPPIDDTDFDRVPGLTRLRPHLILCRLPRQADRRSRVVWSGAWTPVTLCVDGDSSRRRNPHGRSREDRTSSHRPPRRRLRRRAGDRRAARDRPSRGHAAISAAKTILDIAEALGVTEAQVFHVLSYFFDHREPNPRAHRPRRASPCPICPGLEVLFVRLYLDRHIMRSAGRRSSRPRV